MSQSQIGKLYKFYLRKIWQKNRARIIFFTVLYAVIVRFIFVILSLWLGKKVINWSNQSSQQLLNELESKQFLSPEEEEAKKKLKEGLKLNEDIIAKGKKEVTAGAINIFFALNPADFFNESDESASSPESSPERPKEAISSSIFHFLTSNENNDLYSSWKTINEISWFSLYGFFMMYFYIFVIKESLFSSPLKDGEEITVLTLTPGVKRSEVVISKVLAFLTFLSLANLFLFLFPLSFWHSWMRFDVSFGRFLSLALWSVIVEPVLLFSLIITPHIFVDSSISSPLLKQIFSPLISSLKLALPLAIKNVIKLTDKLEFKLEFLNKVGEYFFKPQVFTIVSLICGLSFLALYYRRYQKQDISG